MTCGWGVVVVGFGALACALRPLAAHAEDVAIVVNKANPTDQLSLSELVKIFKQEKQHWDYGEKIYLVMREGGAVEKVIVLQKIYRMGDKDLKKFWLGKLFRGEIAELPNTLSSNEAVKRFIGAAPNAVGVIDATAMDDSVKALRIDGKLPGEASYFLSDSAASK